MLTPKESEWVEFDLFNINKDKCVIYILYDENDRIAYIGRTQSFLHRLSFHQMEKKNIKRVKYFFTNQSVSEEIEKFLIEKYKPNLNRSKKPKEKLFYWKKDAPIITISEIKNFFSENNINISFFSKKSGYTEKFLKRILNESLELKPKTAEKFRYLIIVYLKYWIKELQTVK